MRTDACGGRSVAQAPWRGGLPTSGSSRLVSMREIGCRAGAALPGSPHLSDLAILAAWREAAGPLIGKVTSPVALEHGRLLVEVLDTAWVREIEGLKERILGNLAAIAGPGKVREIRFRPAHGRRQAPAFTPRPHAAGNLVQEASQEQSPDEWEPGTVFIRDDSLRRRFSSVARRYLRQGE